MPNHPNIIWFFDDQHRAQATSLAGDENVSTPAIDGLAEQGVWFRRALSGCPWCTPFRGSLLTSLYPNQNGLYRTPSRLDPAQRTIAHEMNDAGYRTAYFGKWHLDRPYGQDPPMVDGKKRHAAHYIAPERRGGFGQWLGYESNAMPYDVLLHGHDASGDEIDLHPLGSYESIGISSLFVDYLKEQGEAKTDEPFFAVCSIQPPHDPYNPPSEWLNRRTKEQIKLRPNVPPIEAEQQVWRETLQGYYGSIECIDHQLARVMQTLRDTGLDENTYVFFFSDHGDMHGSHGRRGKSMPWEESIRIPCMISAPRPPGGSREAKPNAAGRVSDALFSSVDFAPTTLGLAGIDVPDAMWGYDYSRWLTDESPPMQLPDQPTQLLCQHIAYKRHSGGMDCTWRALVTDDDWKLIITENMLFGMYNLAEDPYELNNLAWDHGTREKRAELLERLEAELQRVGDAYALPRVNVE